MKFPAFLINLFTKPEGRNANHGTWVGLYGFISFLSLFAVDYAFQNWIYDRLHAFCGDKELNCTMDHQIWVQSVGVGFLEHTPYRLRVVIGVVLPFSIVIAYLIRRWWSSMWKFIIPIVLYVAVPIIVSIVEITHDPLGISLVALFYASLIYIMRFALRFNPHTKKYIRNVPESSRKEVRLNIFRIYHQYAILSLAVIGLALSTFIFGFESVFRDFWEPAWDHFPAIRLPFYVSHEVFIAIGIVGLSLGVCREFHVKQEEMLKEGFD